MTPDNWETLARVNSRVNRVIKPVPDQKHFGRVNVWVYPNDGKGDCKAYALVKQRKLIDAGFPREALLITIVWTKKTGHAVLMARTDKGDYILDNLASRVLLWTETTHDYVKRQSVSDPNAWVYIDGYRNGKQKMQVAGIPGEVSPSSPIRPLPRQLKKGMTQAIGVAPFSFAMGWRESEGPAGLIG